MNQVNLTYQIELPGYPAKDVKDGSKVNTDEALRTLFSGSPALKLFADPAQYWIRRVTENKVQTIRFDKLQSACIRFNGTQVTVTTTVAMDDANVLARLQSDYPEQDLQDACITRTCEDGVLVASVEVMTPAVNEEVDVNPLGALFGEEGDDDVGAGNNVTDVADAADAPDLQSSTQASKPEVAPSKAKEMPPEPDAPNTLLVLEPITSGSPVTAQADAPSAAAPSRFAATDESTAQSDAQPTASVSAVTSKAGGVSYEKPGATASAATSDDDDVEDDESQEDDVEGKSAAVAVGMHNLRSYDESLKTITLVIAQNPLDPTKPHLSYAVSVGDLYRKVGVTLLEDFGGLPPFAQHWLDDAQSQWDALVQARAERDAAVAAKKAADAAEAKRKADEARAASKTKSSAKAKKVSTKTEAKSVSATAVSVNGHAPINDVSDSDPAEVSEAHAQPSASNKPEPSQIDIFGK